MKFLILGGLLEILKKKLDKIKFKEMYESQIELYRKKFDMSKKSDKDKFRKGKKKILLNKNSS